MSSQISLMWNQIEKLIKRGTKKDTSEREKSKENSRRKVVTILGNSAQPSPAGRVFWLLICSRTFSLKFL